MSTIEVNVIDQVSSFVNMPVIASGDINADKIHFTLSEEWDGYTKICTFYQQQGSYYYAIVDDDNNTIIPSGAMKNAGAVNFGISGYKDDITRTSSVLRYELVEGAYTEIDPEEGADLLQLIQMQVTEMKEIYDRIVGNLAYLQIDEESANQYEYQPDLREELIAEIYAKTKNMYIDVPASDIGTLQPNEEKLVGTLPNNFDSELYKPFLYVKSSTDSASYPDPHSWEPMDYGTYIIHTRSYSSGGTIEVKVAADGKIYVKNSSSYNAGHMNADLKIILMLTDFIIFGGD